MKERWLMSFILMIFLYAAISSEAISQTAAHKSGANGGKRVLQQTETAPAPGQPTKARRIVEAYLEKKESLTQFTIVGDGEFGKYDTLKLQSPARLVLDVNDVNTLLPRAKVTNENPLIKEVRIGKHPDKVRFVFYPEGDQIPAFQISREKDRLIVTFGKDLVLAKKEGGATVKSGRVPEKVPQPKKAVAYVTTSGMKPGPYEANKEPRVRVAQAAEIKKETGPATSATEKLNSGETPAAQQTPPAIRMSVRDVEPKASDPEAITLEESIKIALERNLTLHSAQEQVFANQFRTKAAFTGFLPTWTGQYAYTHFNSPQVIDSTTSAKQVLAWVPTAPFDANKGIWATKRVFVDIPEATTDVFNLGTTISQPVYTGGALSANYRLEKIGIDIAKGNVDTAKLDIVVQARTNYFTILTAEKAIDVAQQAVKQFEAQLEVSKAFFDVGIVAKNDVLQAEVRLANAVQTMVTSQSALALTKASFNTLLRRQIDTPVRVVDILEYKPYPIQFEESIEEALRRRPEIKNAQLSVAQAKEVVKIAASRFYPTISISGNYSATSDEASLLGDLRSQRWNGGAMANFTVWEWGNTAYKVGEAKVKVNQAIDSTTQVIEGIVFEVKQSYLVMLNAEKNIVVSQKSLEQAEENLRLNEERYKYQVATQTEVLDAVSLLAQARQNYYLALGVYNIAKANLERSMGRMYP